MRAIWSGVTSCLSDRHVHGVAGQPGPLGALTLGGRERHQPEALAAQVDAGRRPQAEGLRVLRHHVAATRPGLVVKMSHDCAMDWCSPRGRALRLPVLEGPVAQVNSPLQ
jgi:hypothetical protein